MSKIAYIFLYRILSLVGVLALFSLTDSRAVFDCFRRAVKDLKKETYSNVVLDARRQSDFGAYTPCLIAGLRSKHWAEEIMLKAVYEASLTLSAEEKEAKLAAADATIKGAIEKALYICIVEKEFGAMFDSIMRKDASSSSEKDDPLEDYCARKLIVENKLIDTVKYNITLNPKNLDVAAVNCEEVLEKAFMTIVVAVTKALNTDDDFKFDDDETQCLINKYREQHFGQKLMRLGVFSELDITAETKEEEKKVFIQTMHGLVHMIKECK